MAGKSWRGVTWEVGYEHFLAYLGQHGSTEVPPSFVCDDGFKLGAWLNTQRAFRRSGRIKAERLVLLDQHEIEWEPRAAGWAANFALLEDFRVENGHTNVPVMHRTQSGKPLGQWLRAQVESYHEGRLAQDLAALLEGLGVDWTFAQVDPFETALEELRRYVESKGDAHVPGSYISPSGFALGKWFAKQKSLMKNSSFPPQRAKQLRDLGVDPDRDIREEAWLTAFEQLRLYYATMGDARVPSYYSAPNGFQLGPWRRLQRAKLKTGQLRADRKELLDQLDPSWSEARPSGWTEEEGLEALLEAATMAYPLTSGAYERLRTAGAVRGPACDWFSHHFASWAAACEAAGVDGGPDSSGAVRYTDAELEASAFLFFTERGLRSSSEAYGDWLVSNVGHPSAASIMRRFGSWPAVRARIAARIESARPT